MAWIGEKSGASAHAGEMAAFAFEAQVLLDATLLGYQTNQRFGLMGIELIGKKDPGSLGIGLKGLGDMSGEVGFGARGANARSNHLSGGHIQIGDQTLGAMAAIFEFLAFDVTGLHRQGRVETLQSLDAGHLISACHMGTLRSECRGGLIDLTYRADLLGQRDGILSWWSEPVPLAVGL
jgi:hypothetical protein